MKLSVWTNLFGDKLSPEGAIYEFIKHGYEYCELSDEDALELLERATPDKAGAQYGRFAREIGMNVEQGHLFLTAQICNPADRDTLKRQFDLFGAIGIKNAVLHCDSLLDSYNCIDFDLSLKHKKLIFLEGKERENYTIEYKRERNEAALRDLLDYVKGTDMTICLENLFFFDVTPTIDDLMYFIDRIDSKNLGICLDTSHLNLSANPNFEQFIKKAGKHLKALHVSDNDGKGCDQHLIPYGVGKIDFVSLVKNLKAIGYDELYNLEIPGERHAPLEVLGYKLDYAKKIFEYIDSIT